MNWDCRIEVVRETVVEAENADDARALALGWFFSNCVHVIGDGDVCVDPMEDEHTDG